MKMSISRFESGRLMNVWATVSVVCTAISSARSISTLKITRPGVVSTISPCQWYCDRLLEVH